MPTRPGFGTMGVATRPMEPVMLDPADRAEIEALRTAVTLIFGTLPPPSQQQILAEMKTTATTYVTLSEQNPPDKALIAIQFAGALEDLRERLARG